ncbi:type I polyketide synthase, partial [Aetokthonos hydrillicola]
ELSYMTHLLNASKDPVEAAKTVPIFFGNALDFLTSHVSYKCNLKGPSITVQTACSTSLVAVHLACQALLNYECDMALAGGVSISAPNKEGYLYEEGSVESPDGHCRAFDQSAKGTVPSNGVGIVVVKRLQDALEDGDTIHAVIKGSAINNDGSQKVGYTAPSIEGQAEAISLAQSIAGVEPDDITYIEAHGTGTPLGDPIEIKALTHAFQGGTAKTGYCAISSLKTNLGHLKAAAGVAALIKTVLALKHKQIPPTLHFQSPNPQIDFANSPFYVNTQLSEWQHSPRIAGVSSFGIGGTNAHMVLEEAPEAITTQQPFKPYQLLLLSARTQTALKTAVVNLAAHLRQHPDINLEDVAFTLQNGRRIFEHRCFVVARDVLDAVQALEDLSSKPEFSQHCPTKAQSVVFLFPGQSQYVSMGRDLYDTEPSYRQEVDRCSEYLRNRLGIDLHNMLYPDRTQLATDLVEETGLIQVALFVVEYALAKLLISWGVKPDAMIGDSIGEYVVATLEGVYSLEEALIQVNSQGKLIQEKATTLNTVPLTERLDQLFQKSDRLFIEVGPGETLSHIISKHPQSASARNVLSTIPHTQSQKPDWLYTMMGQLWLSGVEVDWTAFWSGNNKHRIPLPTYPFERKSYWFESTRSQLLSTGTLSSKTNDVADWFYVPSWKRSLTPTCSDQVSSLKKCLVFIDNTGLGEALATRLEKEGSTIFTIRKGQEFSKDRDGEYTINPSKSKDYEILIGELTKQVGIFDAILHCWNVDPISSLDGDSDRECFEKAQEIGFYSLLYLTQALDKYKITSPIKILAIATETQAVESTDTVCPEKSTLLGACLVIPQEYLNIRTQAIDI